ncbi:hypothetical protein [Lysinibacillus sphaericus]|uniref:hypothetical protein n=1 Tax=Lysinibacillus sphaericus TaxID=1421 RepID=UPI003D060737
MTNKKMALVKAFPPDIKEDVLEAISIIRQTDKLDFLNIFEVYVNKNSMKIPERIYFNEPTLSDYNSLSARSQIIIDCLFTRHHDGFIRQRKVEKVIKYCAQYNWIIPFVIRLTGEYVIEILQTIKANLAVMDKVSIKQFINDNEVFYHRIEQRVISYWNCYHRREYPNENDYSGFEILKFYNT